MTVLDYYKGSFVVFLTPFVKYRSCLFDRTRSVKKFGERHTSCSVWRHVRPPNRLASLIF